MGLYTLDSGINIALCILIFGLLSEVMFLLIFTIFFIFVLYLSPIDVIWGVGCAYSRVYFIVFAKYSMAYVYSRSYVYSGV